MARIALDVDSTLHHYWELLARVVLERSGIELPYAAQRDWGITGVPRELLVECVAETHSPENVVAAEPYPGAVEAVRRWHAAGHWIHVTSHRSAAASAATAAWLERIGMPYDDLHVSWDKVSRCVELGIQVLVDDSPVNLARARAEGIVGATLLHPWNERIVADDGVVAGRDWPELERRLEPVLARL